PLQFQLARGIHELPFYSTNGDLILVAVNRFGRKVARVPVHHLRDYAHAVADLDANLAAAPGAPVDVAAALATGAPVIPVPPVKSTVIGSIGMALAETNARPELDRPDHTALAALLAMGVQAAAQLVAATPDAVNAGLREALIPAARILDPNTYVPIANYPPNVGAVMAAIEGTCPIMRRFAASQYFIDAPRQDTSWGAMLPDFPASLAPDGAVIYIPYDVASTANVTLESVAAAEAPKP